MNIEGGGVGAAVSFGSAAGGGVGIEGGSLTGAASVRGLEGPVSSLEGFVPMGKSDINTLDLAGGTNQPGFSLGGEIVFQAQPEVNEVINPLKELDIVAEAESIVAQVQSIEPEGFSLPEYTQPAWEVILPQVGPMLVPVTKPALKPVLLPVPAPLEGVTMKTTSQASLTGETASQPTPDVIPAVILASEEQEVEEVVEQQNIEKPQDILEEEEGRERKIFIEDNEVVAQRRLDIKAAIKKARVVAGQLGLKKITGDLIAKFMPAEYAGVRSQVVKETGPDGSYQETVEEIAGAGEFESETAAEQKSDQVVAEKKPVKLGNEGTPVAGQDVARVYKYRIIKPAQAYTEVVKRVVKKKVAVSQAVKTPETRTAETEPALKDFPALEGVFPKAA